MSEIDLRDNPDEHRFELLVDGNVGGLAAYRIRNGVVVITHSEVNHRFRGQGLGKELARRTLDLLRERGAQVEAVCPFFARYVSEHHDWDDILVP